MLRKLFTSMLVVLGLCGSLIGLAAAQETMADEVAFLRFGPDVAGNVTVGPSLPVCRPDIPCEKPLADASVQIISLNDDRKEVVGLAVTNTPGYFVVSVPRGDYLVHVETGFLPQCADVKITVGKQWLTFVTIDCDSGLR